MGITVVKIIGIASTVLSIAASALGGWASDKKMEAAIAKKVAEAIAKQTKE